MTISRLIPCIIAEPSVYATVYDVSDETYNSKFKDMEEKQTLKSVLDFESLQVNRIISCTSKLHMLGYFTSKNVLVILSALDNLLSAQKASNIEDDIYASLLRNINNMALELYDLRETLDPEYVRELMKQAKKNKVYYKQNKKMLLDLSKYTNEELKEFLSLVVQENCKAFVEKHDTEEDLRLSPIPHEDYVLSKPNIPRQAQNLTKCLISTPSAVGMYNAIKMAKYKDRYSKMKEYKAPNIVLQNEESILKETSMFYEAAVKLMNNEIEWKEAVDSIDSFFQKAAFCES